MNDSPSLDEQRERIDNAMINVIDDLDREHLRKLQLKMHACASSCCSNPDANADAVQRCVDRCQIPLTRARCYVQQELSEFESQLERCMHTCRLHEEVNNKCDEYNLERCSLECVDKHVALLPEMLRAMRAALEKGL
ncbi:uncharacterized protein Dwil_GK16197 [Drosophila willistoni]|uniref:Protein FAM136A n=1 Tax=Drosophila willistoni TaxID=7260 RepID=B4NPY2_DROWI|nr:protein FAM136A [Drosophila willistoni]EDW86207.1 uncharacterized protein Dwil_GK16197 [Drosophila willistoni]